MYSIYLGDKVSINEVVQALAITFNLAQDMIMDLSDEGNSKIKYEVKILDNSSEFNVEYVFHIHQNLKLESGLTDIVKFAQKISKFIDSPMVIDDLSDDPYQWLYLDNERLFLVEEVDSDKNGIDLYKDRMRQLDVHGIVELLPKVSDIKSGRFKESPYWVLPSDKWERYVIGPS